MTALQVSLGLAARWGGRSATRGARTTPPAFRLASVNALHPSLGQGAMPVQDCSVALATVRWILPQGNLVAFAPLVSPVQLVWSSALAWVSPVSTTVHAICSTASQSAFVLIPCTRGGCVRTIFVCPAIVDMVDEGFEMEGLVVASAHLSTMAPSARAGWQTWSPVKG